MPQVTFRAEALKIDMNKFTKAFNTALDVQMRQAVRAFVRAAIQLIPVKTAMAVGSFVNLGAELRVSVPTATWVASRHNFRRFAGQMISDFYKNTGQLKSRSLGASLSRYEFESSPGKRRFEFRSGVFHFNLNEFFGLPSNQGTPWGATAAGSNAYKLYWEQKGIGQMPLPTDFMLKTTISVGRDGSITETVEPVRSQKTLRAKE